MIQSISSYMNFMDSRTVESSFCFSQGLPGLPGEVGPTGLDGQQVGIAKQEGYYSSYYIANLHCLIALKQF